MSGPICVIRDAPTASRISPSQRDKKLPICDGRVNALDDDVNTRRYETTRPK